ncbi:MAG: hypothetical protein HRT88_00735 [Lentisphaeraceae bacterium]|nr:hypothetical protein [Lentisphaeraceae bacterium]
MKNKALELAGEHKKFAELQQSVAAILLQKNKELMKEASVLSDFEKQRQEIFGKKVTDVEEASFQVKMKKSEAENEQVQKAFQLIQQQLITLKKQHGTLIKEISEGLELKKSKESLFVEVCGASGFADESGYVGACVSQKIFEELSELKIELTQQETALKTRRAENEKLITRLEAEVCADTLLPELDSELSELKKEVAFSSEKLGALMQQLSSFEKNQQAFEEKLIVLSKQQKECGRWQKLHELIGSADGKKFRNFAQGITFEILISHANQQLRKMNERYVLIRDGQHPLEINVLDNYQAGEERTTKNLSGGESFIVSLALALGLSQMASDKISVDTLFLDEGFGTLDEESLEVALETLAGLQQYGKLIGLISHVPALKERITTQLKLSSGAGGCSNLSGPGVSQPGMAVV